MARFVPRLIFGTKPQPAVSRPDRNRQIARASKFLPACFLRRSNPNIVLVTVITAHRACGGSV
jgi:hypothetical protein